MTDRCAYCGGPEKTALCCGEPAGRDALLLALETFRGVAPGDLCPGCSGWGKRLYGSAAGHRGGIGGQAMTLDVCNKCWGSGSASRPWPTVRAPDPAPEEPAGQCSRCYGYGTTVDGGPCPKCRPSPSPAGTPGRPHRHKLYDPACPECVSEGSAVLAADAPGEPSEDERALDTAAEVMERVASALHNGGGTGHEEVRLLEAVKRIRALRRERSKK